jgi:hypothetical protein
VNIVERAHPDLGRLGVFAFSTAEEIAAVIGDPVLERVTVKAPASATPRC